MQRTFLTLAIASTLPALALAQTSVVLNGSIDGALEYVNEDANISVGAPGVGMKGNDFRVSDGVWSGSRFAISGTEDLGGGLKGIFLFEHRFSSDTGTVTNPNVSTLAGDRNQFWAGQSWVGIQGDFGAIRFGRQYSPMFRSLVVGDVTGYSWYNNLGGGVIATVAVPGGWTPRLGNAVSYQSPRLAGFVVHAAYAAGEDAVAPIDKKFGDTLGVSAIGTFGPMRVGVGYHTIDSGDAPGLDDAKELGLSVGAKFGNYGIGLAATQTEPFDPAAEKRKMYYGSLSAGVGAGTFYLVGFKDDRGGEDIDIVGGTLTYSHGLSKRTFAYVSVAYNKVELPTGDDLKPKRVALGVRHFF